MNLIIKEDDKDIDFNEVVSILKECGMGYFDAEKHKISFSNSQSKVFLFDNEKLIGIGRAICDTIKSGAIYDIAVLPSYQGYGLGKIIIETLINKYPTCNYILYANPNKIGFYEKLGFDIMKTGMAYFVNKEVMKKKGFI